MNKFLFGLLAAGTVAAVGYVASKVLRDKNDDFDYDEFDEEDDFYDYDNEEIDFDIAEEAEEKSADEAVEEESADDADVSLD